MATEQENPSASSWAGTTDEWAARRRHQVVMPSGQKAVIQIPELGMLAFANAVPDDLAELARAELTHAFGAAGMYGDQIAEISKRENIDEPSREEQARQATERFSRLLKWLVAEHTLVEPKVTIAQLSDDSFPLSDLDWLYGVATRRVSEDGMGRRLGVARLDEFRVMADKHGCPPDCPHCLAVLDALSTADLGAL